MDPKCTHMKNQFLNRPEGLRQFWDHRWKALDGENPDLLSTFCVIHLSSFFKIILPKRLNKNVTTRTRFASSNTLVPRSEQVLLRCLSSSKNWFFSHLRKPVRLMCVRSITSCSHVYQRYFTWCENINFFRNYQKSIKAGLPIRLTLGRGLISNPRPVLDSSLKKNTRGKLFVFL